MNEESKRATLLRDVSKQNRARGSQILYKVDPPMVDDHYDGSRTEYDHVIVSATDVMFSGPETYIFPANPDGTIASWGELDGSFRGALDHEQALTNAGYSITEVLVIAESATRKAVGA